jgi:hypothetical protein
MKAAELVPEKSRTVLHDIDEVFEIAVFDFAICCDRHEEPRLLDASRPIDRQRLPALLKAIEYELGPVERLAVGELNEFVHRRRGQ